MDFLAFFDMSGYVDFFRIFGQVHLNVDFFFSFLDWSEPLNFPHIWRGRDLSIISHIWTGPYHCIFLHFVYFLQIWTCLNLSIFFVYFEIAGPVDFLSFLNRSRHVDFLEFLDRSDSVDFFTF